jgi:hypothetical protein
LRLETSSVRLKLEQIQLLTEELIPTRETFHVAIALVSIDAYLKVVGRNELQGLSENRLARVHGMPAKQSRKQSYGVCKEAKI